MFRRAKQKFKKSSLGRKLLSAVDSGGLNGDLQAIADRVKCGEAISESHKTQAYTSLLKHVDNMNIESVMQLFNDMQGPRGKFMFIREERGCMYRLFSNHGRTDTYRKFVARLQQRAMSVFHRKHPIGRDGRYNWGNGRTHILEGTKEVVSPFYTLQRIRPLMLASYNRCGTPAVNTSVTDYVRLWGDAIKRNGDELRCG